MPASEVLFKPNSGDEFIRSCSGLAHSDREILGHRSNRGHRPALDLPAGLQASQGRRDVARSRAGQPRAV